VDVDNMEEIDVQKDEMEEDLLSLSPMLDSSGKVFIK
jgi:hypothetical protein